MINLFNIIFKPSPDGSKSPLFNFNIGTNSNEDLKMTAGDYEAADKFDRILQHIKKESQGEDS